jgi:uracil-DNA glycosylase
MNLLQQNLDRYLTDHNFLRLLGDDDICVLSDFVKNREGINTFCQKLYGDAIPRVMICGINPGRFGAGMTGIPFLDFISLSQLIPSIDRVESEKSASFFFRIVSSFGAEAFFRTFYVSNFSSVGYLRNGKNLNYYDLPPAALAIVESNFIKEIEIVKPTHVISLSKEVHQSVCRLLSASVDCSLRLPHPSWVATYRSGEINQWVSRYMEVLEGFRQ